MTGARLDVLVLGGGVAGLTVAIAAAARGSSVAVLTKEALGHSTTRFAQGGIAAAQPGTGGDSTVLHGADTLAAGAGLCDEDAVAVLVEEGPGRLAELMGLGARFDRGADGSLLLAREGGHSMARVVHSGGAATGAEVERALSAALRGSSAEVLDGWLALDLVVGGGRCLGVSTLDPSGRRATVRASNVVLATGGVGQLFAVTTNPAGATGDGTAMALRAGVAVADLELVQFHPTALHRPGSPRPLMSEALRGAGAVLRDARGDRFVDELASRDVVSSTMATRMAEQGVDHLWLDATDVAELEGRFPSIVASLRSAGIDARSELVPVAPAAHYACGGVLTDLDGASNLPGLWAVGEAACSGVHGANRLASNSLLEGLVFGGRAAEAISSGRDGPKGSGALGPLLGGPGLPVETFELGDDAPPLGSGDFGAQAAACHGSFAPGARQHLQEAMTRGAGVVRSASSLRGAARVVRRLSSWKGEAGGEAEATAVPRSGASRELREAVELANLVLVGRALLAAATARRETRGAHVRSDHPSPDPAERRRLAVVGPGR